MVRTSLACLALAVVAETTSGQTGFTSPPGYLSTEGMGFQGVAGSGYSSVFGGYAFGRYQLLDGDIKAKGVAVLNAVGFRHDYRQHGVTTARARSWSNVSLTLSDGDFATMGKTFDTNKLSTPNQVFLGSVAWPGVTGYPKTTPAKWSAALRFPFKTNHVYLAQKDLLLEFQFYGGTLVGAQWPVSQRVSYMLDGLTTQTQKIFGRNIHKTTQYCADSAIQRTSVSASSSIQMQVYSEGYPRTGADSVFLVMFGDFTAPGAPVMNALSLAPGSGQLQRQSEVEDLQSGQAQHASSLRQLRDDVVPGQLA